MFWFSQAPPSKDRIVVTIIGIRIALTHVLEVGNTNEIIKPNALNG